MAAEGRWRARANTEVEQPAEKKGRGPDGGKAAKRGSKDKDKASDQGEVAAASTQQAAKKRGEVKYTEQAKQTAAAMINDQTSLKQVLDCFNRCKPEYKTDKESIEEEE